MERMETRFVRAARNGMRRTEKGIAKKRVGIGSATEIDYSRLAGYGAQTIA
jgi:hypothetical protein